MNRHTPTLIAVTILTLGMSLPRPAAAQAALRPVYLLVSNQAGVPADVLMGALAEMSRIYQAIGVEVITIDDASNAAGPGFVVNLVPEKLAPRSFASPLGTAMVGGILAYVVFERVERFATTWGNHVTMTLGLTLAHELGHLLLKSGSHTVSGLMSATWNPADATLAASGRLLFWPADAARIRRALAVRP